MLDLRTRLVSFSSLLLAGCLDAPPPPPAPPIARLVVAWDPAACGDPHRVALELEDDAGVRASSSAPCWRGGLELDLGGFGVYRGRIYRWAAGEVRAATDVRLVVDDAVVHWWVTLPP